MIVSLESANVDAAGLPITEDQSIIGRALIDEYHDDNLY